MTDPDAPKDRSCPFWQAFRAHRNNARRRHIPFLFSFEEWKAWWLTDDRWAYRGRHSHGLVMARRMDVGPYSPGNVECVTAGGNNQSMNPLSRAMMVVKGRATKLARGTKEPLSQRGDGHPRSRAVMTPAGRFGSAALAADHYGITRQAAALRARARSQGWSYV